MEFKDYYQIMGIKEDVNQEDIKRSYRKLARKYHPDVSKETNAETRFKELGEAYEVLKDPEKRAKYDKLKAGGWQQDQPFTPPPEWETTSGFRQTSYTGFKAKDFSEFFNTLFSQPGYTHPRARGEDLHHTLKISLEEAYHATIRKIQLAKPEIDKQGHLLHKTHRLNVKIPSGVVEGQQIRLKGQGGEGLGGGPSGDLYLKIHITPHRIFILNKRDILLTLPITPWEAALGAQIKVPTLSADVALKIPANSKSGQKLRLSKRGLPGNPPGDFYIQLQIQIPKADTPQARALYQQMAKQMPFNPREKLGVNA